jgi:hypothetical protein
LIAAGGSMIFSITSASLILFTRDWSAICVSTSGVRT